MIGVSVGPLSRSLFIRTNQVFLSLSLPPCLVVLPVGYDVRARADRVLGPPRDVVCCSSFLSAHLRLGLPARRTSSKGNDLSALFID